jgi:hypothetical protein
MAEKKTYRIQGTVSLEEREEYLALKAEFENDVLKGTKLSDGQYIMTVARLAKKG